ncbi:MAG: 1-acyl-sn-glycerol-3-phosphate acyltransferase [Patescibacteria group bacterium]|nr:1-acyl-sn-glycerol-3-phosphate acyltransferase [Patescibacteria group bacterium]
MENQLQSIPESELPARRPPFSSTLRWVELAVRAVLELRRFRKRAMDLRATYPDDDSVSFGFERECLANLNEMMSKGLNWEITHNEDLPEKGDGDRFVYIANHPTLTTGWIWAHFMAEHFAYNTVAVGKKEIITRPDLRWILGDVMKAAGKGIFIDRDKTKREETAANIRRQIKRVLKPDSSVILLADAHRPYDRRLKKEHKKWVDFDTEEWMTETCFPRSGELFAIGQGVLEESDVRFLDCTIAEPKPVQQYGARLHFDVKEVTREELFGNPESVDHLKETLASFWKRKNEIIRDIRSGSAQ